MLKYFLPFVACDPISSCDLYSCYDDVEFTKAVINHVSASYCIDLDSIHLTGISNGGQFSYFAGKQYIGYNRNNWNNNNNGNNNFVLIFVLFEFIIVIFNSLSFATK